MKRALIVIGSVLALALLAAAAANRPLDTTTLLVRLNGQPQRWIMADGGASGMFGSGQQCMTITSGDVVKLTPSAAMYLCAPSPLGQGAPVGAASVGIWDGGCSNTTSDAQSGDYIGANVEHYVVSSDATTLCQQPVTGSVNTPVFRMK